MKGTVHGNLLRPFGILNTFNSLSHFLVQYKYYHLKYFTQSFQIKVTVDCQIRTVFLEKIPLSLGQMF